MTVFWSGAQHHVTTSLMTLAVCSRNVATNLGTTTGCVVIEYCFSIIVVVEYACTGFLILSGGNVMK